MLHRPRATARLRLKVKGFNMERTLLE